MVLHHAFENFLGRYGKWIYRYRWHFLTGYLLLCLLAGLALPRIRLDSNLSALLPENNQAVENLDKVTDVYGGLGYLVVLVRAPEAGKAFDFSQKLEKKLAGHPKVRFVETQKPFDFFRRNMLLYIDPADLKTIYQRLKAKIKYEKTVNDPSWLGLEEIKDPGLYFADLVEKYETRYGRKLADDRKDPWQSYYHGYDNKSERHTFLVLLKPRVSALKVKEATAFLAEMENEIAALKPGEAGVSIDLGGRYRKSPEDFRVLRKDFRLVTIISLGGIFMILLLFFHSLWPILVIFIPLLLGILLTMGFVAVTYQGLNLITTFLAAILLGLGIDFGIHLLVRFEEGKKAGLRLHRNFLIMMSQTGAANFSSALTTALAFYALSFTEFKAFREFGVIAGTGILLLFFSMVTLLPVLLLFLEQNLGRRLPPKSWKLPAFIWRYPRWLITLGLVLTVATVLLLPRLWFDFDFSKIQAKQSAPHKLDPEIDAILNRSQNPTVILPSSLEEERAYLKKINQDIEENRDNPEYMLARAYGISIFIPKNQAEKLGIIAQIRSLILSNQKYKGLLPAKIKSRWQEIQEKIGVEKITDENLPATIQRIFKGRGEYQNQNVILMFPKPGMTLGLDWVNYADDIRSIRLEGRPLPAASDEIIFAEILRMIQAEGPWILLFALLAVIAVVALNFHSLPEAVLLVGPLMLGVFWILGALAGFNLPLDFFNIIMLPIVIGIGIDSSIHVFHRFKEAGTVEESAGHTAVPVFLSSVTSIMGFGALTFASNRAMGSMGTLVVLGIVFSLVVSVLILPALLKVLKWRQK